MSIDKNKNEGTEVYDIWGKFYIDGNVVEGSSQTSNDNWTYGVFNQFHSSYGTVSDADKAAMKMNQPHELEGFTVTTHDAEEAYELVLGQAGANLERDEVDSRIIASVQEGDFDAQGSNGSTNGIIDTQSDVGGWPMLEAGKPVIDTDEDGIPDDWETTHELDPENADDGREIKPGTPYTYLEIYLNSLVTDFPLP